ncbi:hypothetical protein N7532_007409 [Penicillium argentinense]|uniref:MARVEL domain-containing protein n=1 Tax=Penicillium argentinense TaxID=1131581 RepID=A0A9W9F7M8_9EURO|nr:uncharacterized protein N7532_007409 [Penicillium argentinense]KAJ5095118.1 hypothetical protein N7532_007409 [Penicillium argentinense]
MSNETPSKETPQEILQYWHKPGPYGIITRATLRTLQFTLAIIIAALYGVDLSHASKHNLHGPTEWVYAELVAALSAITCLIHISVRVVHVAWSTWDGVLFVLWLAQTGVFGCIYITNDIQDPYRESTRSISRMRAAVWIDFVNILLWLLTTVLGIAWCVRTRKITRRLDLASPGKRDVEVWADGECEIGLVFSESSPSDAKGDVKDCNVKDRDVEESKAAWEDEKKDLAKY